MFEGLQQRHIQFLRQAQWTKTIRAYLLDHSHLLPQQKYLEVGCGTGAILADWNEFSTNTTGIDIDFPSLHFAQTHIPNALAASDALALPFPANSFDCIFSHYFFLWVKQPIKGLQEIRRCLKPTGFLFIFAEPDYSGRIDYPCELSIIRELQIEALGKEGADPSIGIKLQEYLKKANFTNITGGILGSEWSAHNTSDSIDMDNILFDIKKYDNHIQAQTLLEIHNEAIKDGTRISYVPTFFYRAQK
jgi:ubiquinone/menaquinone biosynthesis C-methylase UbiE